MKRDWIYNFSKILQNHKDVSDYERFYISYKLYIKENISEHSKIFKVLLESLYIFKNSTLLSITYRLIRDLNIDIKISKKILRTHFRNRSLRKSLFPILKLTNTSIKNEKIKKLLYDENYEDKYFFDYISHKKDLINDFLKAENPNLLRKQLLLILSTKYFYNMDYFIKFLGSSNRHIGFLVYEVMSLIISEKQEFITTKFKVVKEDIFHIEFIDKLEVESLDNFLINFLCFMKNKVEIYNLILENKIEDIEKILREHYVFSKSHLSNIKFLNLYSLNIKPIVNEFDNLIFDEIDDDYEFLFTGSNYKSISDCVEL